MLEITAPAKINLSLKILGKRADGFHELDTLMTPLALADTLTVEKSAQRGVQFTCDDPTLPSDGNNLVERAAALFLQTAGLDAGVKIHLAKKIPHGAGLGGGSSDAASTLLALNQLFETGLPTLSEMAASLGSDIPFFLAQGTARCQGRGEIVQPAPPIPSLPLLLIKPPFGIPTPWAYQHWAASKQLDGIPYAVQKFDWGELENDLERPVFEKYLILAEIKHWLLNHPAVQGALLSGSGSTVFAVLKDEAQQEALQQQVKAEFGGTFWTCFTRTRQG